MLDSVLARHLRAFNIMPGLPMRKTQLSAVDLNTNSEETGLMVPKLAGLLRPPASESLSWRLRSGRSGVGLC